MTDYLEAHKKIKKKIEERIKERDCGCVSVNNISEELNMDIRTVKTHLELMKVDDYGAYLDDNERLFCPMEGVEKFTERIKRRMEEKE